MTSKTVGKQSTHGIGGGWMVLRKPRLNSNVDGRMQLSTSGSVLGALVLPPHSGEAVCLRGSLDLPRFGRHLG